MYIPDQATFVCSERGFKFLRYLFLFFSIPPIWLIPINIVFRHYLGISRAEYTKVGLVYIGNYENLRLQILSILFFFSVISDLVSIDKYRFWGILCCF